MPTTYPNQRIIKIHREVPKTDFLGIRNENWKAAARDLSAHALKLYLYFAANADNYEFALSQAAVTEEIGMARSTFHDQFHILVNKGYLINTHGNTYVFFEKPQPRPAVKDLTDRTTDGLNFDDDTTDGQALPQAVSDSPQNVKEINNINIINNKINSESFVF